MQRSMGRGVVMIVGGLLFAAASAGAREVHVNNAVGDNAASGHRSEPDRMDGPVATIERALELVTRGDRIVLANTGQPYREMISLSDVEHRGYPGQPLVIQGNGAVLEGSVAADPRAWRHEEGDLFSLRSRRLTYQQMFLAGEPLRRVGPPRPGGPAKLEPLQWALLPDRLLFRVETGRLPQQYDLAHAGLQTGITLYGTEHVRIEDLIVQGFQQDGINAHERVSDCVLRRVECRGNGRSGISVGGVSRVTILESGCYDNGRAQLRVEGLARVVAEASDFDPDSGAVPWLDLAGGQAVVDGQLYQRPPGR